MRLEILNYQFRIVDEITNFVSFIWTERWNSYGDFLLKVPDRSNTALNLLVGRYLRLPQSRTLMRIERVESDYLTGEDVRTATGRSILSVLTERVTPRVFGTQPPERFAYSIVSNVCITGNGRSPDDVIPNLKASAPPVVNPSLVLDEGPTEIYSKITSLADEFDFGIRMDYDGETKDLTYHVYHPRDRTENIVFSPSHGNLDRMSRLRSNENFYTHAYVNHSNFDPIRIVSRGGASGLDRRVLLVDANGLQDPTTDQLLRYGREELSKHKAVDVIDGEIRDYPLVYNADYRLGDTVLLTNNETTETPARVTEHIWSYDSEGERSFPTLEVVD